MKYSVRPVAFRPEWVEEFGDMQTAIFYQQIFYWEDKGKLPEKWIFKTIEDFEYETTLTKDQQKRCRERLVSLGYIEIEKRKAKFGDSVGAPVLHFRIIKYPANALSGNPTMESRETRQWKVGKPDNPLYTESTTENTTENTLSPQKKICGEERVSFFDPLTGEKPKGSKGWLRAKRAARGKASPKPRPLSDEMMVVDRWVKAHRAMAERQGEDYSFLDDGDNKRIRGQIGRMIPKILARKKTMEDWFSWLEHNQWAQTKGYNPMLVYTDAMLVNFSIWKKDDLPIISEPEKVEPKKETIEEYKKKWRFFNE